MALRVAWGGQSPDLKSSHANHILMTQGAEKQGSRGEKVLEPGLCWALPHPMPKESGELKEAGLPHRKGKALTVLRASDPNSRLSHSRGPWLDELGGWAVICPPRARKGVSKDPAAGTPTVLDYRTGCGKG